MADSKIDDGGPAFPWGEHGDRLGGMSLRDYFAGQALAGLGNWIPPEASYQRSQSSSDIREARAKWAYAQADAMLDAAKAAREGVS